MCFYAELGKYTSKQNMPLKVRGCQWNVLEKINGSSPDFPNIFLSSSFPHSQSSPQDERVWLNCLMVSFRNCPFIKSISGSLKEPPHIDSVKCQRDH